MMVTFVSQCEKKALFKTRRVLDAFANRIGDKTWQTVITMEGLKAVKSLLKKTASKNTAVACHWMRSRSRSQLVWIVGSKKKFNSEGVVPVNSTENEVAQYMDSNQWQTWEIIRYAAAIAGLFHDFGKANLLFQKKLQPDKNEKKYEPFRHEWISMRLFQSFVGIKNDIEWLDDLSEIEKEEVFDCFKDGIDEGFSQNHPFSKLSPFAQLVSWLILSHHKLPLYPGWIPQFSVPPAICYANEWLDNNFEPVWNSPKSQDPEEVDRIQDNWSFKQGLPVKSIKWRSRVCEIASAAKIKLKPLIENTDNWLHQQLLTTHLARLCLMLADHHYSSQDSVTEKWQSSQYKVYANTVRNGGRIDLKQQLDEHLIGVAHHAELIAKALPRFNRSLLSLGEIKFLEKKVRKDKTLSEKNRSIFSWQDDAIIETKKVAKETIKQGFFGINMASTGKGKTLGNAKIMYALGNETERQRFTVALGLRTLTLQTGKEYREKLNLNDEQLAIMVGSSAVRTLFENDQNIESATKAKNFSHANPLPEENNSESQNEIIDPDLYIDFKGAITEHSLSEWTEKKDNDKMEKLINAPVLVCTIDHLISATEGTKGGKQIGPMLRLLSSDLVLDEPDDFGLEDLPALCRLVYWSGMLGSRLLLSTATLPPALAYALFQAYQEGWKQYALANIPDWDQQIICAWFDEFESFKKNGTQIDFIGFKQNHEAFTDRRLKKLKENNKPQRQGKIIPIVENAEKTEIERMAETIREQIIAMHDNHHQSKDGKYISIGLIRMANIDPLVAVAKELLKFNAPQNTHIHYCIYHGRYPLAIRHHIEKKLDAILKRKDPAAIWENPDVKNTIKVNPQANNLIFIVFASPVAEVGRDHDYDWAIVEPSSMRSIIQLAGRVLRHRDIVPKTPNIGLLNQNYKALKGDSICFVRPGFEYPINSEGPSMAEDKHCLVDILDNDKIEIIDASSRINLSDYDAKTKEFDNLINLEHKALAYALFNKKDQKPIAANIWWRSNPHWCGEVQRQQRFRYSQSDEPYILYLRDENSGIEWRWRNEHVSPAEYGEGNIKINNISSIETGSGNGFWFDLDPAKIYSEISEEIDGINTNDLAAVSRQFGEVRLIEYSKESVQEYEYHPELGIYKPIGG